MKRVVTAVVLGFWVVLVAGGAALAGPWSLEGKTTVASRYIWRGMVIVDDTVLQPEVNLSRGSLALGLWANYEPTDATGHARQITEVDLSGAWSRRLKGALALELGVIHYLFPNTPSPATTEVYATGSWDGPVTLSLSAYQDVGHIHGTYIKAGVGRGIKIAGWAELGLGAWVAWGSADYCKGYFGVDSAGLADWGLSGQLTLSLGRLRLSPGLAWSSVGDEQLREAVSWPENIMAWVAVGLEL